MTASSITSARARLTRASDAYFNGDKPLLSDAAFDALLAEVRAMEAANPELVTPDSPTQTIGAPPREDRIEHPRPMLSLGNAIGEAELEAWHEHVVRLVGDAPALVREFKVDGVACSLIYEHGVLVRAATRGDGRVGRDITAAARAMGAIPERLGLPDAPAVLEVRGEIHLPGRGAAAAAAALRAKPLKVGTCPNSAAHAALSFFAYSMPNPPAGVATQSELLAWLEAAGFAVNHPVHVADLADAWRLYRAWLAERELLGFDTDGIVLKLEHLDLQALAGEGRQAPRWAIALK